MSGKIVDCHVVCRVARRATGLEASLSLQKCSCKYIMSYYDENARKVKSKMHTSSVAKLV